MAARHRLEQGTAIASLAIVAWWLLAVVPRDAWSYTSSSPEVRAMIDKAAGYLEQSTHVELGGKALIALGIIKAPATPNPALHDHPKVQEAVKACQAAAQAKPVSDSIYNSAIAAIFLCELDAERYRQDIEALLGQVMSYQKEHGGFGYKTKPTGDTSQTQYGVLCMWYAKKKGFDVSLDSIERVSDWLIRTQDAGGGWGYQGVVGGNRQEGVSLSLSSAAAGSVYICADMVQMRIHGAQADEPSGPNSALVEVKQANATPRSGPLSDKVNGAGMRASIDRGNQWFRNNFKIKQDQWNYYYLYALERYMSFQEIARGRQEAEPAWYNEAVDYMRTVQTKDGSFDGTSGRPCSTAFAVLFLTRSTQKSIGKIAALEANLLGGRDLPKDVSNVRQNEEGEVVKPQIFTDITKLVDALNDPNFTLDEEAMRQVMELPLDRFARDQDLVRMRKMVSAESPAARLVAVRALAQSRQLDNVPLLIYALSDGDNRIKREAEDGLRFISRKFKGFNMPDNPTPADVAAAQNNWKNWYLSIRPDAKFLD